MSTQTESSHHQEHSLFYLAFAYHTKEAMRLRHEDRTLALVEANLARAARALLSREVMSGKTQHPINGTMVQLPEVQPIGELNRRFTLGMGRIFPRQIVCVHEQG